MATITFTATAAVLNRVQDAICANHNYTGFSDRDNTIPQTKAEFAKAYVTKEVFKKEMKEYESKVAIQNLQDTVAADVDSISIT